MTKTTDIIQAWFAETLLARLHRSRILLVCHGILTDKENEKVKKRLTKMIGRKREVKS
jgi:hypothetical protein